MARATGLLLALLNVAVATAQPPRLAARAPNRQPATIDTPSDDRAWGKSCKIHHPCRRIARRVRRCPAGTKALTIEEVQELPGDGRVVSVGGPLRYGDFATTAVWCTALDPVTKKDLRACCNHTWGQILLGEGTTRGKAIYLEGVGCSGDESRSCCDLIVKGQQVVVTGALHETHDTFGEPSRYSLGPNVKICDLDGATGR